MSQTVVVSDHSGEQDTTLRTLTRAIIGSAAVLPIAFLSPAIASAAGPTDVTYAYDVVGNSVTNTITSAADGTAHCSTSLAPAPGGVLPPLETVLREGQTLFDGGDVAPGVTTQTVTDVPPGSYVVLATCALQEGDSQVWWVSDYPGIAEYLDQVVPWTTYTVPQASTVVTIGETAPELPSLGDVAGVFGS